MAQSVSLKANGAEARVIIIDKRGRIEGDPTPRPALTLQCDLSTMDGVTELESKVVELTVLLVAGTPVAGQMPASTLIGGGKPFAVIGDATAWRDKLVAIYEAMRSAKGWE